MDFNEDDEGSWSVIVLHVEYNEQRCNGEAGVDHTERVGSERGNY